MYQVNESKGKEPILPLISGAFSAIHNNKMIIVGGAFEKNGSYQHDFDQIYSFPLGT